MVTYSPRYATIDTIVKVSGERRHIETTVSVVPLSRGAEAGVR
jgi:hypothetical protein